MTQRDAALAVIGAALAKSLPQIALAQSTATLCDHQIADEFAEVIDRLNAIRQRISAVQHDSAAPLGCCDDANG
jgi:hypothetical protein